MIKDMEKENLHFKVEVRMKVIGRKITWVDLVNILGLTVTYMREILSMELFKAKVRSNMPVEIFTKVNGKTIKEMDMVC